MTQVEQTTVRNRLLAALAPALQPVALEFKQVLYEPGQVIRAVHFPEAGVVSNVAPLEEGHGVQVGVISREGLVGLPRLVRARRVK